MMNLKAILFYVLLGLVVGPVRSESFTESDASELLKQVEEVYWQHANTYRKFADDTFSPEILLRAKLQPFYATMQKYNWQSFQNPTLKRQFQVLLRGAKYPQMDSKFKKATHTLKSMSRKKWVCPKGHEKKCNWAFVSQIKSVFTNSDDRDEIKYYWQAWRNGLPLEVKEALHYYIDYYKQLSTPQMNASAVWYDQYEDPNFINDLEQLMETIGPMYRELHAHMRQLLRGKYGESVVPPSGLIPHHLFEQVTYQAWKKDSVLCNPFPSRRLPNLQAEMDVVGYTPFHLVNISQQFFGSIGCQNITDEFMQEHFIPMELGSGGPDCKSRIFDFGEIELNYCPKVYYKKLLQSHGDLARIQYALAKNHLPVGLNEEACPGFGNALGEAVILSASTPKYLQKRLGLLKDYEYDDLLNLNRLYRLAVHTLLTLPTYFVHEKLWVDMIDGKIAPAEYNCHYWNLMERYMGVEAPVQTNADTYDMPYKFYEGIVDQYRSTKKIIGEFMGYQIYRAICLHIGEFERGNAYKTLDNCDFSRNKNAGTLFNDIMSAGSSKPWREIIKPLTHNNLTSLSGTAFIEYFDSLLEWLSENNINENQHVGWSTTDKCKANTSQAAATDDGTQTTY